MKLIAPDYYGDFKCIASDCRHSCCIGWEIDIDEDMLSAYDRVGGSFGKRLRSSIDRTGDEAHFILGEGERCPFLNEKGLCDIIIEMGEDSLCDICADHPRFRNFLSDRTEIGLGLCCEAAGRLILSRREKVCLIALEDDGEAEEMWEEEMEALEMRESLFAVLQNREKSVNARLEEMLEICGIGMPGLSWREIAGMLRALERLDPAWEKYVEKLASDDAGKKLAGEKWETAFEQLAVYFLYRHFIGAAEDGDVSGRVGFAALSTRIIRKICEACAAEKGAFDMDDLVEIARMYSSEIEYSDENLNALMALFSDTDEA